jgi:hypothetical protein
VASAATPEALQAAAATVSLLVANAASITPAGASAALDALLSLSSAGAERGVAVNNATAFAVAASLSSIVGAAVAPGSTLDAGVLQQVLGVVDNLAASQLVGLAPGAPPVEISSPAIQMRVQIDVPGPESRLFSQSITAPGSASAFAPLPSTLFDGLAGDGAVRTQFLSLTFDPWVGAGGADDADASSTGITRLAFSRESGEEIVVAGLATPLTFTLPPLPSLSAGGAKAVCQFWDVAAAAYATHGCASLPEPRPASHTLAWTLGFQARSDADMAAAWSISGPLLDDNCVAHVLDCSAPNATDAVLFPNPAEPLAFPGVACSAGDTAPLRVFTGSRCALIQPDNAYRCAWDNGKQAFTGAGCVASGAPVSCACRHLTDFAGVRKPSLPVASAAALLAVTPADILTRLRLLFIVIITLFAGMHAGAALAVLVTRRERALFLTRLMHPGVGFRTAKNDADCMLWRFSVEPLAGDIDSPTGPAVELASLLGLPIVRLRACIPDELLSWSMGDAVGRRHCLCKDGMSAALPLHRELVPSLFGAGGRSFRGRKRSSASVGAAPAPAFAALPSARWVAEHVTEEFVGTALVLAFLQLAALLPPGELAQRRAAAAAHFAGVTTPGGWSFDATATAFLTLLSPGIMGTAHEWLPRARLWRLVLSQRADGSWGASHSVAFALEARPAAETANLPRPRRLAALIDTGFNVFADEALDAPDDMMQLGGGGGGGGNGGAAAWADVAGGATATVAEKAAERSGEKEKADAAAQEDASSAERAAAQPRTCPMTCSRSAIVASVPGRLSNLAAEDATVDAERLWTTMCAICALERLNACWLSGDGSLYPERERTIVDAAREWIEACAAASPALAAALADGVLQRRAAHTTQLWHRAVSHRVEELRRSDGIRVQVRRRLLRALLVHR